MLPLLVRVSRPYYYLVTLWLYLMPTGGRFDVLATSYFWLGIAYCTLPLNLLCYWMNDVADVVVDRNNARKGGQLLGAKEDAARLRSVGPAVALVQLPFLTAFATLCGARIWPWFGGVVLVNWLYNFGPHLSSGRHAPLDLVCPCGYLLVILLGSWLNGLPIPPPRSWGHAALLVVRTQVPRPSRAPASPKPRPSREPPAPPLCLPAMHVPTPAPDAYAASLVLCCVQLWIQTFDLEDDAAAARRTTAVRLGLRGSQLVLSALLVAEIAFVYACFDNWPLRSFSAASLVLLGAQYYLQPPSSKAAAAGDGFRGTTPVAKPAAMSAEAINTTFLVLGLGGLGLMGRVWLDAAFVAKTI